MWVYYALMIVSVMLFGGNFALKNVYALQGFVALWLGVPRAPAPARISLFGLENRYKSIRKINARHGAGGNYVKNKHLQRFKGK